ncbi:MAG: hypothetical protein ACKN9K_16685, partial [Dolichospermum sp.]
KTSLCLYHRYIPGVPHWSNPEQPESWRGSPFYVALVVSLQLILKEKRVMLPLFILVLLLLI